MNNAILQELKIVVEQAVRPVRATLPRKRRMREELLAHLVAIFEEETQRLAGDRAALEETKKRFGDPHGLTAPLQETVPRWDKLARLSELGAFRDPHESLPHFAGRISMLSTALSLAAMLTLMPFVYFCGRPSEFALRAHCLLCIGLLTVFMQVSLVLLAEGMYRALYRNPCCRCWRLAAIYTLASFPFFPLLGFVWHWSLTGDLATNLTHLEFAWVFAPLSPVLFALLARQGAEQWRHYEEWASLEIEE